MFKSPASWIWLMASINVVPQIYMLMFGGAATSPETVRIAVIIGTVSTAIVLSIIARILQR